MAIPYALNPRPAKSPSTSMGLRYSETGVTYYEQLNELIGSKPRVLQQTGHSAAGSGSKSGAQGASGRNPSKRGNAFGPSNTKSDGTSRANIASSIGAIATRRAKFGDTKLKSTTARKLKLKGFEVGKSSEIPLRSGQNRPKGEGA